MKNKNSTIIAGAAGLTAIIAAIGLSLATFAQDNSASAGKFRGMMGKGMFGNGPNGEAMKEAIANNDYQSWLKAVEGTSLASQVSEEQFGKMVQLSNLMAEGEYDEAKALKEELGLNFGPMMGMMGWRHFKGNISPEKLNEIKAKGEAVKKALENVI